MPHIPQFMRSRASEASQPFPAEPSQSAKPASHAMIRHVPPVQLPVAFGGSQGRPQAPHAAAVSSRVSQPSVSSPSQSPKPASHEIAHAESTHVGLDAGRSAHATPQPPQFAGSLATRASQPFASMPSQSPNPPTQPPITHSPPAHAVLAFASVHRRPQPPQFSRSVDVSKQRSPHRSGSGAAHDGRHARSPLARRPQTGVDAAQLVPQSPHVLGEARSASQPLAPSPSQSPSPAAHESTTQVPVAQLTRALVAAHAPPQAPQSVEVASDRSHPSASAPLQLAQSSSHAASAQEPATQRPAA